MTDPHTGKNVTPAPAPPNSVRARFGLNKRSSSLRVSQRTLGKYSDAFTVFDKNGDGAIGKEELAQVLYSLGQDATDEDLKALVNLDENPNAGKISFEAFVKVMTARMTEEEKEDELKGVFDAFDQDGDGYIALSELKSTLQKVLGENFDEIDDLIGPSIKKQGKINFQQFRKLMDSSNM